MDKEKNQIKSNNEESAQEKWEKKYNAGGCLDSPEDKRDFSFDDVCSIGEPLPERYLTEGDVKVLNQGSTSMCVAFACSTAMKFGEHKAGFKNHHDFSRGMIYGNRRDTDYQGEGMYIRQALKQLNHDGDCMEENFSCHGKYLTVKEKFKTKEDSLREIAKPYIISNYFRCYTQEEVKRAVMNQGAVIVSINIYNGFGAKVKLPKEGEKSRGGHAMCCIGWDETGWIVRNSWGYYTPQGNVHIPYDYPINEWWGITVNKNVPEPKKTTIWTKISYYLSKFVAWLNKVFASKSADSMEQIENNDNQTQKENINNGN